MERSVLRRGIRLLVKKKFSARFFFAWWILQRNTARLGRASERNDNEQCNFADDGDESTSRSAIVRSVCACEGTQGRKQTLLSDDDNGGVRKVSSFP